MNSLPLFSQELPTSCIPACVRMVLAYLGFVMAESEIRARCGFSRLGINLKQVMQGFQDLPVLIEHYTDWSIDDISDAIRDSVYPIVGVDLRIIEGIYGFHAVVLSKVTATQVVVHDPLVEQQPRKISLAVFEASWKSAGSEVLTFKIHKNQ